MQLLMMRSAIKVHLERFAIVTDAPIHFCLTAHLARKRWDATGLAPCATLALVLALIAPDGIGDRFLPVLRLPVEPTALRVACSANVIDMHFFLSRDVAAIHDQVSGTGTKPA